MNKRTIYGVICSLVFTLLVLNISCTKEVNDPIYPTVPAIALLDQSATELISFEDTLRITLNYTDGDGDLGGIDGASELFVLDQRLEQADVFALQSFTSDNAALSISGTLQVVLGPYFVLGNADRETFALELWITDRAGNTSNRVTSSPIIVRKP